MRSPWEVTVSNRAGMTNLPLCPRQAFGVCADLSGFEVSSWCVFGLVEFGRLVGPSSS
jgi:hypothetical protein